MLYGILIPRIMFVVAFLLASSGAEAIAQELDAASLRQITEGRYFHLTVEGTRFDNQQKRVRVGKAFAIGTNLLIAAHHFAWFVQDGGPFMAIDLRSEVVVDRLKDEEIAKPLWLKSFSG